MAVSEFPIGASGNGIVSIDDVATNSGDGEAEMVGSGEDVRIGTGEGGGSADELEI